jgi:phenylalanyl-tRNA synthetase alpha chain
MQPALLPQIEIIESILVQSMGRLAQVHSIEELTQLTSQALGKSGSLSGILKSLATCTPEQKKLIGQKANDAKIVLQESFDKKKRELLLRDAADALKSEHIDIFAPSTKPIQGTLHPLTQLTHQVIKILSRSGFEVISGQEIETDFFNFEAVNIPLHHPARDMQDTFFLSPSVVLRTHTSGVQMRALLQQKLPLSIVSPGAVYRADADATHSPMFHQIEGLVVDQGIALADLKACLQSLLQGLFGSQVKMRLRSSFFPFVEPGVEVDIGCMFCKQGPCKVCKETRFVEVLGAGMVHPSLFQLAKIDPSYSGFAFGLGIERLAMLVFQIPDIRLFFKNDTRFLSQFH